ncbi:hypothetical protein A2U01_0053326, partial [Trifolium medium]|nr:hypothetical protein [Trifolium medium]
MENQNNQQEQQVIVAGTAGDEETIVNENAEEPLDLARSVRELTAVVNNVVQAIT